MPNHPKNSETLPSLIRSSTVKAMFDGISDMTLWRWIKQRGFPAPTKLHGRNYWNPEEIEQWHQGRLEADSDAS
jgi:predicted DNA-binding transcriptional regulator AlpA